MNRFKTSMHIFSVCSPAWNSSSYGTCIYMVFCVCMAAVWLSTVFSTTAHCQLMRLAPAGHSSGTCLINDGWRGGLADWNCTGIPQRLASCHVMPFVHQEREQWTSFRTQRTVVINVWVHKVTLQIGSVDLFQMCFFFCLFLAPI